MLIEEMRRFAISGITAKAKAKKRGSLSVCIPPIANCAMDGAPVGLWLAKERTGNNNSGSSAFGEG